MGYVWGFVGPVVFALGLVWLYVQRIPEDGGTTAAPYVLLGLGAALIALRGLRRLLDRDRRGRRA